VAKWLGTAVATPTVAGVPEVDVTHAAGEAQPAIATPVDAYDAVLEAIAVDARPAPGQGALPEEASMAEKIDYIYKFLRNPKKQTDDTQSIMNEDGVTVDHKADIVNNSTTFTQGKFVSGA
jgi:hypothetical protein